MKVDWGSWQLSYQVTRVYALVTADHRVAGRATACKDYLTDMLAGSFNDKRVGFPYSAMLPAYDPKVNLKIPFDRARVLFGGRELVAERIIDLIHQVEGEIGIAPTTCEPVENSPDHTPFLYLEGDPTWLLSPPLFGLWTVMMRAAHNHEIGRYYRKNDCNEVNNLCPLIDIVRTQGPWEVFGGDLERNWPILSYPDQHDSVGPHSYCEGVTARYFPHWKHPKNSESTSKIRGGF